MNMYKKVQTKDKSVIQDLDDGSLYYYVIDYGWIEQWKLFLNEQGLQPGKI